MRFLQAFKAHRARRAAQYFAHKICRVVLDAHCGNEQSTSLDEISVSPRLAKHSLGRT